MRYSLDLDDASATVLNVRPIEVIAAGRPAPYGMLVVCRPGSIYASFDSVCEQIKAKSPAGPRGRSLLGHAAGHYKRALEDIEHVRKQLHEGCRAWNKSLK